MDLGSELGFFSHVYIQIVFSKERFFWVFQVLRVALLLAKSRIAHFLRIRLHP